jgi:hypothetical protein
VAVEHSMALKRLVRVKIPRRGGPETVFRPNGPRELPPGFTLGKHSPHDGALKGRQKRAGRLLPALIGLGREEGGSQGKPWAKFSRPFGAETGLSARR